MAHEIAFGLLALACRHASGGLPAHCKNPARWPGLVQLLQLHFLAPAHTL